MIVNFKKARALIVPIGKTGASYTIVPGINLVDDKTWEQIEAIARENNMSMTEVPDAGTELTMPDASWNRTMQNYCKNNDVSPATAMKTPEILGSGV